MTGIERIAAERKRQVGEEGWTAAHDDAHRSGELADAGAGYALHAAAQVERDDDASGPYDHWPFEFKDWKPSSDPIRNLEKAGALIAAEIDRLLRLKEED